MSCCNGQVSVEYMLIIGFVTVITIPLIIIYQTFNEDSNTEINSAQVEQVAKKVVDTAESMYYLGEPSQTSIRVNIPNGVKAGRIGNNEIVFNLTVGSGTAEIVRSSPVNITGSLPSEKGTYTLTIKAYSGNVTVSYT